MPVTPHYVPLWQTLQSCLTLPVIPTVNAMHPTLGTVDTPIQVEGQDWQQRKPRIESESLVLKV